MFVDTLVVTVTTGVSGARGDTKCAVVVTGDAGDVTEVRMDDSGGGAGATKPVRVTDSVLPVYLKHFMLSHFDFDFIL